MHFLFWNKIICLKKWRNSKDSDTFWAITNISHKECANIDSDTFLAIANITGSGNIKGLEKYKDKEEINMCKAFEENWLDGLEKGKEEGRTEGREEGALEMLCELVRDGLIKSEEAAKRMNITESAFNEKMKRAQAYAP